MDEDINEKLRLNGVFYSNGKFKCDTSTGLIKGRRDAYFKYDTIVKMLAKKGRLTSSAIKKEIDRVENEVVMQEFAGVVLFFLYKKYKSLIAQGK